MILIGTPLPFKGVLQKNKKIDVWGVITAKIKFGI